MQITKQPSSKQTLTLDYRLVAIALVLVIAGMFALWRPWENHGDRTVEVTGQATVSATPDEYLFYPSYEFTNTDRAAALAAMAAKSDEIVKKLKEIGVPDSKIKTDANGHTVYKDAGRSVPTYVLQIAVTAADKDQAQKVQDYLVTTVPVDAVSPQSTFSDAKRRELESKARDDATKDARSKAEQSAKNLGFSVGAVKAVNDGAGFGGYPLRGVAMDATEPSSAPQLSLQPGENELTYSVTVTYFVR